MSALDLVSSQAWAITPDYLRGIAEIAARRDVTPEALQAKLGAPLENTRTVVDRGGVAVIPITGPIFRRANMFTRISGATSIEVLATDLQSAIDDPEISAIVLEIDSPGGQVAGTSEFADMVARSSKPVHGYAGGSCCSAAYWIASACRSLTIQKTAAMGSIGVVATYPAKKEGQIEIVSSNSPHKRADPKTADGHAQILAEVDAIADVFVDDVAGFRRTTRDRVLSHFGKGGVLIGKRAVAVGMADRVGDLETVLAPLITRRPSIARPRGNATLPTTRSTGRAAQAGAEAAGAGAEAAGAAPTRQEREFLDWKYGGAKSFKIGR